MPPGTRVCIWYVCRPLNFFGRKMSWDSDWHFSALLSEMTVFPISFNTCFYAPRFINTRRYKVTPSIRHFQLRWCCFLDDKTQSWNSCWNRKPWIFLVFCSFNLSGLLLRDSNQILSRCQISRGSTISGDKLPSSLSVWYKTKVGSQNFGYQLWFCTRLLITNWLIAFPGLQHAYNWCMTISRCSTCTQITFQTHIWPPSGSR